MNKTTILKTKYNICPECGDKFKEHKELYINECDRCLAKKVE